MNAGEKFTLTETWWKAGKPALLTDTGLSGALRTYESAHKTYGSTPNAANYTLAVKALEAVDKVRLTTIEQCGSKDSYKTTKDALKADKAIHDRRDYYWNHFLSVVKGQVEAMQKTLLQESQTAEKAHTEATGLLQKAVQHQIRLKPAYKPLKEAKAGTKEWLDAKTLQHNEVPPLKVIALRLATLADEGAKYQYASLDKTKALIAALPSIPMEGYFKTQVASLEHLLKIRAENQKKFQALAGMVAGVKKAYEGFDSGL